MRYLATKGIIHFLETHLQRVGSNAHFQMTFIAAPPLIGAHVKTFDASHVAHAQ